ncbi:MAG: DUF433 domain-containing protein [Planctomycetota bacterium]
MRISFGRPVIAGTSIRTEIVIDRHLAGESTTELANNDGCESALIEDATRCERLRNT